MELTLLFVFAFTAGTFAGPIQEVVVSDQCAKQCAVSSKFNYETGKTYEFTYTTELRTAIQGASEDQAGVDLSAKVYLDFLSKCDMVLRLSDVKLTEQVPEMSAMKPVTSELIAGLEQNPLTVSFQDGNIEELCLSKPENEKILNIKRGILSLIQNNMDDISKDQKVTESDVSGECETEYTSTEKGWYNKLIKKSKNLLGCTGRHGSNTAIQGIPYASNSDMQSLPLLKSTHECEQDIEKSTGQLKSARCFEQHILAPFSRLGSGATTHNTQTLTFVKEYKSRSKPVQIAVRAPIQFQHSRSNSAENTRKDIEQKLMEICSITKDGVTPETPTLFTSLVYTMKAIKFEDLKTVFQKIKSNEICSGNNDRVSKFFLDAIPMTGTIDSLKMMVQLLTRGQVTGLEADMWMTSLSFMQTPSIDMLAEVKSLLTIKTNQEKAMLSVSSLVHTVCKNNPSCGNLLEVKKIISLLENNIASSCKISDNTFQTSLLSLRAIGNAGFGTGAIPTLVKCIKRTDNPVEIRLSAIEAFRRIPCKADKSVVLSTFTDIEEDSEIRIAAYKALMECPSDYILSKVKATLGREEVNQVGSYVWSHLTNLMETSDPHKQSIRSILEDETLQKEFDMDKRKFSRNYEKSLFIEKLNTGAAAEGDLIWSSKSFIPRSAMVNLTVDLFGNAVNLFEIGGRLEGLEYFLESYFGPSGYFSENGAPETVEETAVDIIKSDKVKRMDKRNKRDMEELRGSLYLRVFGNELRYMNFQGLDSLLPQNNFNILDMLMKLSKENEYQYTHSSMFMDSSMIVPTSSGFPLNLTLNGTATVDLKASGKMDVMKLTSSPPTLDVHGIIRPSGAVVISSIMGIDALDTQVGIKMVSTLHTSTSVQGKVSLAEGTILNAEFDLPEEKQELISISSSFYTVHRHSEKEQKMITENRQEYNTCSGSKLAKITGLQLCGELSFPNASLVENAPYFPLAGPVRAGVTLYKRDKKMSGYKLQARSTHTADENIIRLDFSTPNSNIDRHFGLDLNLNKVQGALDVSFNSPWKKADFKGTFQNEKYNKEISGKMNWDGDVRFDVKANLQSAKSGPGMTYTPTVKISIPERKTIELGGSIKYAPWKYFETDISLSGITAAPISVKTSIQNKDKIMSASASMEFSPKQVYLAESSMQTTEYKKKVVYKSQISVRTPTQEVLAFGGTYTNVYGTNIEVDMVLDKIVEKPVILKANVLTKQYRRGRLQKIVKVDFRSKTIDIKMKNKFDNRNGKTLATDTDLTYVFRRIARDNIKLVTKLINLSSKSLTKAKCSMNFASKRYPIANMKLISNINHNKRHSEVEADIAYGPDFKDTNRQISFSMSEDRAIKSLMEASATLNGKLFVGNDFRIITKLDHSHEPKSLDSNVMLRLNKEAVSSSISWKDTSKDLKNLFGQLEIELPGKSIAVSQLIKENAPDDYTNTMNARYGKSKNTIVTSWKKISPSAFAISSDIKLNSVDPIQMDAEYSLGQGSYKLGGSINKASSRYSAMVTSQSDMGKSVQISTDLECPTRHIISNFEGTKSGNKFTSRADIRWNANRDDTQRITINGNSQMSGLANVEGSLTVQYPSRTIALNIRNSKGNKYATHIDLQWEPSKIMTLDSTFGDYTKPETREIIGTIKLNTPFSLIKSTDITLNHQINSDMYQTKFDVKWNPKNTLSSTMTIRKPLSLRSINMDFIAKAPTLGYKSIQTSLQHNIKNGMSTIGKLTLNKQSVQVDLSLTNKGDDSKTDVKGQIDVKTSFRRLRTATITFSHRNNGRIIDSSALLKYNKKQMGVEGTFKTRQSGWQLNSNGDITIYLPSDSIKAAWGHKNTLSEMTTSSEITWDNKRISVNFNGLQDLSLPTGTLSAALEIQTPFNVLRDAVFQLNHLHKNGQIDSTFQVTNNGNSIMTIEGKYLRENGKVKSRLSASNPLYDGIVSAVLNADYENPQKTGHLELSLTPLQTLTFDCSHNKKSNGDMDTSLTVYIPNKQPIEFLASREKQGASVESTISCKYENDKIIRLESLHSTGAVKQLRLKFTSPFNNPYTAAGEIQSLGNNIRVDANIEAEPFLSRWSISADVDTSNGVSGNLKVNTPYQNIPYSQISVLSEVVDGSRQSSIVVEYVPGRILKLTNMFLFNSYRDMQTIVELSTPFEALSYTSAAFRHQGDFSAFSNYGEIEYNEAKASIESKFSSRSGIQASVNIKSPFAQDISGMIRHDGNINNFVSHGEVTWGKTVSGDFKHEGSLKRFTSNAKLSCDSVSYSGNINFSLQPKMVTDISIDTPIPNFESIKFSHSLEGGLKRFSNHAELSTSGYGSLSSDVKGDFETTVSLIASAQTPLKSFRDIKIVFTHQGSLSRFSTSAKFKNGESLYSGDVKMNAETNVNFEATLETPFKSCKVTRLSLTKEGALNNLKLHIETQLNKEISELDLICNTQKKYDIDLTIRSPYTKTIKASLDHWGNWKKFSSKLDIRSGKTRVLSSVRFALKPTFNAMLSIKSPFAYLKNQQLFLKHVGSSNSFKCNMQYKCNGKAYFGDASFHNLNTMNAELNLKGPTFRPINVAVLHEGKVANFKSSASMSMGKKNVQVNANFNAVKGIKGNVGIVTPFEGFESITAAVSHTGEPNNFKSHGEITHNRKSGQVDVVIDTRRDVSVDISITTPFKEYRDMTSSLKYQGAMNNFSTLASFSVAGNSVVGQASFQTSPSLSGSASLKSNFEALDSYDASFNHEGNWRKFKSDGEFNIGSQKNIARVSFDSTNGIEGRFGLTSPFVKKTDIHFKHSSNDDSLNTNVMMAQNDAKQYGLQLDLSRKPVSGIVTLTTPHKGFESTELSLHHDGTANDFRSNVLFDVFGEKYEGEIVFEASPDMQVLLTLRSPMSKDIKIVMSYQGTPTNFNSRFNYLYGKESNMLIESSLNIDGPYSGNVKLISPLMKNIKASFSHDGGFKDFKSEAQVVFAGKKTDLLVNLNTNPEIQATLRFSSPLTKEFDVKFSHNGPWINCKSHGAVTYGGKVHLNIDGQFKYSTDLNGYFKMSTLIPGFSQISTSFSHSGDLSGFQCHASFSREDQSASGDFKYSPTEANIAISTPFMGGIDGSYTYSPSEGNVRLSTPFMQDIRGSYKMNGKLLNSASEAELSYGRKKLIQVQGNMNYPHSGEISMQTPVKGIKNARIALKRTGDIGGNVVLELNGKTHQGDISINTNRKVFASLSLNSPLMPQMSTSIDFSGKLSNFRSHADFTLQGNKHAMDAQFSMKDKIEGNILVTSPLVSDLSLSFSTNTDLRNLVSSIDISYDSKMIFSVHSTFDNSYRKACTIDITIVDNSVDAAFTFDGVVTDFKAHAEVNVNNMKTEGDATFSIKPISASVSLKSIFTEPLKAAFNFDGNSENCSGHWELTVKDAKSESDISFGLKPLRASFAFKSQMKDVRLTFSYDGSLDNFRSQTELSIDNQKMESDIVFNIETAIEGSASLHLPEKEPMKVSFEHKYLAGNLKNLLSIQYGRNTLASSEITFSSNPVKATISIKSPFEGYRTVSGLFSHNGEMLNFNNQVEIVIEDQKSQGDMSFNFGSKMEGRISVSSPLFPSTEAKFEFSGTLRKFSTDAAFNFAEDNYSFEASVDSTAGIDASATLNTPIQGYRTMTSRLTHSGHYPTINSFVQMKTGQRNFLTGSVKIDNIDGINGKLSFQSVMTPTVQINIKHTGIISNFNTNAEVRVNGKPILASIGFTMTPSLSGSMTLTTPFTSPVAGSFDLKSGNNEITLHAEGSLDKQSIIGDATLEYGNTIGLTATLKTPLQNFEVLKGSFTLLKAYKGFTSNAQIEVTGTKIEVEATSSWRKAVTGSVSIKTPYNSFRRSSANFSISAIFPNIETEMNVLYSGQKYSVKSAVDNTNAHMMITTPYEGFEDLSAKFNYEGKNDNMQAEARVIYMTGKEVFGSFKNMMNNDRLQTKVKLETPYTEDISIDFELNGILTDFTNTVILSMGDANAATSTTTFKFGETSLDFDTNLKTILAGYSDEQRLSVSYDGVIPNIKASANAKFLGSYFSFDSSFLVDDSITGMLTLKTPIAHIRDVVFNFEHTGSSRRFSTNAELQYDTNKKLEGSVQYTKYGWRRLQTSINLKTPFAGFEMSKASYRHTASVDSFECDAGLTFMNKDFNGNIRASMEPLSASVSVTTPFSGFEQMSSDTKLTYDTGSFNVESNVQYMKGKTISLSSNADITSRPQTANIKLTTPFKGYENSEIRLTNNGNLRNFESAMTLSSTFIPSVQAQANMRYVSLTDIDGSVSFSSQTRNFESLKLAVKNIVYRGKYNSKIQTSWTPSKTVTFAGTFTENRYSLNADVSLTTPFRLLKELTLHSETESRGTLYTQKLSAMYNGNRVADMDLSTIIGDKKSTSFQMRSPLTLFFEVSGSMDKKYEAALTITKDIRNTNNGMKITGIFDPITNVVSIKHTCPWNTISFDGVFDKYNTKFDLINNGIRYGYDMVMSDTNGQIKVILPSRSLQVSGSKVSGTTEGAFMWDAERDETKKIGFRSVLRPNRGSMKADVTVMMPSIGKEVQIDSQMSVNKGRVLFDGKTEMTYSPDSRKKFTIMSRLEDISNSLASKNYSFTFGISHPYTSVDVLLSSHFGNSNQKMTSGINMKYQTARREVKTFTVHSALDKARNAFSIDMDTPMKKIGINGNVQTDSPYRLSLSNKYDAKRPLNTVFSFDTNKRSVDFQMNYDLENPGSEFHLSAKYVNISAVATEMFHVVNRQRVTDALLTLRLNSSSLLHSRIHWRPDMIDDLKALSKRHITSYERRLRNFAHVASDNMKNELNLKAHLIGQSFMEEVQPMTAVAKANMEDFAKVYETNEYHIRDIADAVMEVSNEAVRKLAEMSDLSEEHINIIREKLEESYFRFMESYRERIKVTLKNIEETIGYMTLQSTSMYGQYADHVYNISKPIYQSMSDRYNKYVQYMNQLDTSAVSNVAEKYTSAIYGARGIINSGLASFMNCDHVKYVKSISDRSYQQCQNAYKYWEVRENSEMVARAVADWIGEEVEKEISDVKATVLNLMKSKTTVYDPKNGNIQMEFHLPIPLKSLDVIPKVDLMPYISKTKSYIPTMPSLALPSTDVSTWLPPFDAMATIQGNKISTFDGLNYDLQSSCTFMLARDYVNSNFSVILNKDGDNKTMIIVKGRTSIKIFSNGQVSVNENPVEIPAILNDITVTSLDDHVTVSVAGHLNVDYYKDLDTFMIKLNGYYYGKTNGLLGSYDNESSNDLVTSFGRPSNSVERFSKTWEIGTERCR